MEGYQKALTDYQIPLNEKLVCRVSDEMEHYSMENGYITTKRLLESHEPFTAVYATSDTMAVGVYRALREAGRRIPEDVSVMGFDGNEIGDYIHPKLTTLAQPVEKLAEVTFELLEDMIDGRCGNKTLIYEGNLTEKDSVRQI